MRLVLLTIASLAFFFLLGTLLSMIFAPVEYIAQELHDWLEDRVGEAWAVRVTAIFLLAAVIALPTATAALLDRARRPK